MVVMASFNLLTRSSACFGVFSRRSLVPRPVTSLQLFIRYRILAFTHWASSDHQSRWEGSWCRGLLADSRQAVLHGPPRLVGLWRRHPDAYGFRHLLRFPLLQSARHHALDQLWAAYPDCSDVEAVGGRWRI